MSTTISADSTHALFLDLIDPDHRMKRYVETIDAFEFTLEPFFRRIEDQFGSCSEDWLLDLDEAEQTTLSYAAGEDLVDLTAVDEDYFVQVFFGH